MNWELEYNGTRKTLAEWKISGVKRMLSSADVDTLEFTMPAARLTDDPEFPNGAQISIFRDGVQWFRGQRIMAPAQASPSEESVSYQFAGPWTWLDQLEFQQPWYALIGGGFQQRYTSHVFLCLQGGALLTAAQQITSILQYAIDQGAPIQIGTIEGTVYPVPREERDITCAEAIRSVLAYLPDTVVWFDYSTSTPTIHCRPRSSLTAVSLDIPGPATQTSRNLESISITPRYDLQRPAVKLTYEIRGQNNDQETFALYEDVYPPTATGREFGAMTATIDAQGVQIARVSGTLESEAIDTSSLDWWKSRIPWLAESRITELSFVSGADGVAVRTGTLGLPNQLISGSVADWMNVQTEREKISVKVKYTVVDPSGGTAQKIEAKQLSVGIISTDSDVGSVDYQTVESAESGDPIPVGLAEYLYNKLSILGYDGSVVIVEPEISGVVSLGNVLNISSGRPEWLTMNAVVQRIVETIDTGRTEISFGPPRHLSIPDLIGLLRVGRNRRRYTRSSTQEDGEFGGGSDLELGDVTPQDNGQGGATEYSVITAKDGRGSGPSIQTHAPNGEIKTQHDTAKVTLQGNTASVTKAVQIYLADLPEGKIAKFRETKVCVNGVEKTCYVLRTEEE